MIHQESEFTLNNYHELLDKKTKAIELKFSSLVDLKNIPYTIHSSSFINYRMRAEFRVWHDGDGFDFVVFDKETKKIIKLNSFPPANLLINSAMMILREKINSEVLKRKLFQIDFLSTSTDELLISLIYHKILDTNWEKEAQFLMEDLQRLLKEKCGRRVVVKIIGRARKQKFVLVDDFVVEKFDCGGQDIFYKQVENSFTQPNYEIAQKMLSWALEKTKESRGDLLEMYCGNGNFSLYLSRNFKNVLATEISSSSVEAALYNIEVNNIKNVKVIRLSAEEFTEAVRGDREFKRLKDVDLKSYQCETILVDPPRSGLDDKSLEMVSKYDKIIYISCNPDTLYLNLLKLNHSHLIESFALFDQFPFTDHIEVGVVLLKRTMA